MTSPVTVRSLFDSLQSRLGLEWAAGRSGADRAIEPGPAETAVSLVGHLNPVHLSQIQVFGRVELDYLATLDRRAHDELARHLFTGPTAMILVAEDLPAPAELTRRSDKDGIALIRSPLDSNTLILELQYFLGNLLADKVILHGVFMEVMGMGVLLSGEAGIGKSELALELISRGHRLIADDAPEFSRIAPDIINGTCPNVLREFLEVRGLGIINVRAMFGDSATKQNKYLRLIIHLEPMDEEDLSQIDRLHGSRQTRDVLGVPIPEIRLPVAPGRNLAVLAEIAVRNHMLTLKGYEAHHDFVSRQQALIDRDEL